jgi:hypothetical protein
MLFSGETCSTGSLSSLELSSYKSVLRSTVVQFCSVHEIRSTIILIVFKYILDWAGRR